MVRGPLEGPQTPEHTAAALAAAAYVDYRLSVGRAEDQSRVLRFVHDSQAFIKVYLSTHPVLHIVLGRMPEDEAGFNRPVALFSQEAFFHAAYAVRHREISLLLDNLSGLVVRCHILVSADSGIHG